MTSRGKFIVFEGPDGSGKSTQSVRLANRLSAILTIEPGGTGLGLEIRKLLLDPHLPPVTPRAEALLFAAARAQHVAEVIRPALDAGNNVVCDRFTHSSMAYQGAGRGLGVDTIREFSEWATESLWPDLVVYLDVADEIARANLDQRIEKADRLDVEASEFHRRTNAAFREFVDAACPPEVNEPSSSTAVKEISSLTVEKEISSSSSVRVSPSQTSGATSSRVTSARFVVGPETCRWLKVDGSGTIEEVAERVFSAVGLYLESK